MEPYIRGSTGKFPLSSLAEETAKGVGITGASVPSRALLGLKALYAAVDVDRSERARCSSGNGAPSSSSRVDGVARGGAAGSGAVTGKRSANNQGRGGDGSGGGGWRLVPSAPKPPPSPRVPAESFAAMPLLGHRYEYVSIIGTGRFSDVIRADDSFRPGRSVAIKVINIGCEAVAVREVRFMRFLGSVPNAEFCPVVRLLDVLTYRGHCCLVTELFDGSLSSQDVGGDAGHSEDGKAAAPAPAMTPDYAKRGSGPARGSASGVDDQGMRDDREGLERCGVPPEPGSGLGQPVWGGDGGGDGGGSGSSSYGVVHPDTTRASGSVSRTSTGSSSSSSSSSSSLSPSPREGCPTHVIRHVALQLVSALLLLRNHGLIHADIKPENVLLRIEGGRRGQATGGGAKPPARRIGLRDLVTGRARMEGIESLTVRLCDFGNAIHKSEAYLYFGDFEIQTLAYRAPEVVMGCPFGPAVDSWSVGVILLELLIGRPLFATAGSRAALLQQTVCAFGPMPLRRFRVGHFFSEYYAQDQSLKVGTLTSSPRDGHAARMGCCSCCWPGNKGSVDGGGVGQQANLYRTAPGSYCDGHCAHRCRRPGRHSEGSAPFQASAGRRVLGSGGSTGSSSRAVAHAHLSGLINAAGATVSTSPGSAGRARASISTTDSEQDDRQQTNPLVRKPLPRRFGSSTSDIARQNPRLLSLLAGLLCLDPDERLTPLQALAHPFFGEALPFAALPQTTTAAAAERPCKPPAVKPQETNRADERADGSSAASTQHRSRASVAAPAAGETRAPRSPARARSPSHQQHQSSPSLCDSARRKEANTGSFRPNGGNKRSMVATGLAAAGAPAARVPLPSPPENSSRELDPTAQLRRLAEMAGEMVGKGSNKDSRGRDGGAGNCGGSSDTSSTAPVLPPRRNPFLSAELLARLKREEPPVDSRKPGISETPGGRRRQQQQANPSLSRTPPASRRRPNPFLSPATLTILNSDPGVRKEATAAAVATPTAVARAAAAEGRGEQATGVERLGWSGRRATPAASNYHATRDKVAPSPDGKPHSVRDTPARDATRAVATAQQRPHDEGTEAEEKEEGGKERKDTTPCEKREPDTPTTTKRKRTRRSPRAADSNSNVGASPSRAREGSRKTTPRRAAVAAGVAILRLRDDDESSDGSMTL